MFTTGHVGVPVAALMTGSNGEKIKDLNFGVLVEVQIDHGDGWPLVLSDPDGDVEIGFVNADFVNWDSITVGAPASTNDTSKPSTTGNKTYTSDPLELPVVRTQAKLGLMISELQVAWPALNETGARTMAAQYWTETQGGSNCYDWNFGNRKAWRSDQNHMFLRNVWECFDTAGGDAAIKAANGFARYATSDEINQHGWRCPNRVVVFAPPHTQCKFLAYASMQSAIADWCGYMKSKDGVLQLLNAGDTAGFAHALKLLKYYSASESNYAAGLASGRAAVDLGLA